MLAPSGRRPVRHDQFSAPAPFELTEEVDTAARTKSALFLQSSAGNRAVASTLAQVRGASRQQDALRVVGSPTSTAAPPRGGVVQISNAAAGMHAAGYTSLPAPGAPDVVLGTPLQQSDGGWQATINPTTVTPDPATSLYPGEGLHDDEPTPDGTPRVRDVTKAASAEIKQARKSTSRTWSGRATTPTTRWPTRSIGPPLLDR